MNQITSNDIEAKLKCFVLNWVFKFLEGQLHCVNDVVLICTAFRDYISIRLDHAQCQHICNIMQGYDSYLFECNI